MTRDDIIRVALQAGFDVNDHGEWVGDKDSKCLERFAALVSSAKRTDEDFSAVAAAEREKVATWMIERDYATGHGDTIEGLLKALEWQAKERARGFL